MSDDLDVISYDLKIYLKALEAALGRKDIENTVEYLKKIRQEADENLEFLAQTYEASIKTTSAINR